MRAGRTAVALFIVAMALARPAGAADSQGIERGAGWARAGTGTIWFTATVRLGHEGRIAVENEWRSGASTSACMVFARRAGEDAWAYGAATTLPRGSGTFVSSSTGTGPQIRVGSRPRNPGAPIATSRCVTEIRASGLVDVAAFTATDHPVTQHRIRTRVAGGRILAQSSGRGTVLLREAAFAARPLVAAGHRASVQRGPVSAGGWILAMAGAETRATFRRASVGLLLAGRSVPSSGVTGGIPALLSAETPAGMRRGLDAIAYLGPAGRYRYRIEAMAEPWVAASAGDAGASGGKAPTALLAAADVDWPACRTPGARVIARAPDGHPICAA